jgi:hypothetical protein
MPDPIKQDIWPRAVTRLGRVDPYAAALVAEHGMSVQPQHRGKPSWAAFFARLEALREDYLLAARRTIEDLERDYRAVELGDLLSLMFCNGWHEPFDRRGYTLRLIGDRLHVSPDPFAGADVLFRVEARVLPARPYRSQEDLDRAYAESERRWLAGIAGGQGGTG